MEDAFSVKTVTEIFASRPKTYSYLTDDNYENKKVKKQNSVS